MNVVLDAGALIGIDRDDRRIIGLVELGRRSNAGLVTAGPVVGQAWRDGAGQARLARLLPMIDVRTSGLPEARAAGELLARAETSDVVDALLCLVAAPGDQILTGDADDLRTLADARGIPLTVVRV